ncbi:acyltransferase [Glycomyces sp. L485]|uniref:acyltransferase family protein n=1 Tax=Glycomyces sp. L485 TaxID=2909235 RepID=UPI001F4BC708|nr:acyltransferase family protein [Glycomyces sp. L485]MCH7231403.1 acyltransferase [Glycomyces sp. L485]
MTSPQSPSPGFGPTAGTALDEDTIHLPKIVSGPLSTVAPSVHAGMPKAGPGAQPRTPHVDRPPRKERWDGIGFRPDIQGLRAVAVMLVLASHAGLPFTEGGYVGVDVFFVLSGFLITSLLVKEVFDTGKISIAGFYARRARRILPAASAVTIVTVAAAWLWFPVTRLEEVMRDALAVIAYYINYRFVAQSTEYLNADQMPSPFQQYWSLAVEEQFYLVWPLLLIALLLAVRRAPRKLVVTGVILSVVIFAVSLAASVLITEASQPTAYYAGHTRAWELAAGAFLALTLPTWKRTPRAAAWILGMAGFGMIIASGLLYTEQTAFPGYTALLPVMGTVLVIAAGTAESGSNPVSSLLGTRPFQFVGKISYSLYLWHWPILILGPLALGIDSSLKLNLVLMVVAFAAAQLSYEYIEEPVRNWRPLRTSNLWGIACGVVCSLLGVAMIVVLTNVFPKADMGDEDVDLAAVEQVENEDDLEERLREGLETTTVPNDLKPALANTNADRPVTYPAGCHLDFEVAELPDDCAYGDTESDTTVVLIGDSHGAQWFPALEAIASNNGWKLISRTKSACTPVSVRVESTQHDGEYAECWDWKQNVFDEVDELRPDLVVIGSSDSTTLTGVPLDDAAGEWESGWTATLDRVTAAAGAVVTLTDTPWKTDEAAPDCLALHTDSVQTCLEEDPYAIAHEDFREAGLAAQGAAGVTVVDTADWFCVEGGCPLIVGDLLVYRDGHHISTPYATSLSPLLAERLPQL